MIGPWQDSLMRAASPLVVAAVMIGVGAMLLLFGWRLYRVALLVAGAVLGAALGARAGEMLNVPVWLAMAVLSLLGALLAVLLEKVGIFIAGGLTAAMPIMAARAQFASETPYMVALALGFLIGGVLALYLWRPIVIVGLAITGATLLIDGAAVGMSLATRGAVPAWTRDHPLLLMAVLVALTVFGVYFQTGGEPHREQAGE